MVTVSIYIVCRDRFPEIYAKEMRSVYRFTKDFKLYNVLVYVCILLVYVCMLLVEGKYVFCWSMYVFVDRCVYFGDYRQ